MEIRGPWVFWDDISLAENLSVDGLWELDNTGRSFQGRWD